MSRRVRWQLAAASRPVLVLNPRQTRATRFHPATKDCYTRLRAAGKPNKTALVA